MEDVECGESGPSERDSINVFCNRNELTSGWVLKETAESLDDRAGPGCAQDFLSISVQLGTRCVCVLEDGWSREGG